MYDIGIIGAGISGFTTALRLQALGYSTLVLEAHGIPGGCAGYFKKKGFSFDVGATTLVDFEEQGVGGKFFTDIGLALPKGEYLDYKVWLPDRELTLLKDPKQWKIERLKKLGNTEAHQKFWKFIDKITHTFWQASRKGIKLPLQNLRDIIQAIEAIGVKNLGLGRYLTYTMGQILQKFHLENDKALTSLFAMLIEDTCHSSVEKAPFINACLGASIRGAGLMRPTGGMQGFWKYLKKHYLELGGTLKCGHKVEEITQSQDSWTLRTRKGDFRSKKLISSLPIDLSFDIAPPSIRKKLFPYIRKNEHARGSAVVVFLGVPEAEVKEQELTHHQLLFDYAKELGNGNNMFISISAPDDRMCAPEGYRAVMISTHCGLEEWQVHGAEAYQAKRKQIGAKLIKLARKVYPSLAMNPKVYEIGTPLTYQKFTSRKQGAVGGFKQFMENSNFKAVPHDIGIKDFWITGDSTWPGLGTVAGIMSSRIVTEEVQRSF